MKTRTLQSIINVFTITTVIFLTPMTLLSQTTINLAERCDCEITKYTSEVTAGATTPAGETQGDMLIDPSGDLFFWDGDSWEYAKDGDWTVNGTAMYNNNSGNVGVGNTNPDNKFHITSGSTLVARIESTDTNQSLLEIEDGTGVGAWLGTSGNNGALSGIEPGSFAIRTFDGRDIHFGAGDGPNLSINAATDNIGIGTTTPSNSLHIATSNPSIRFQYEDGSPYAQIYSNSQGDIQINADPGNSASSTDIVFRTDGTERMRVHSSGRVGIGTDTPPNQLHVDGAIGATAWIGAGCEGSCSDVASGYAIIYDNGNIRYTGTLSQVSDQRLKKNVATIGSALDKVKKLRGVYYNWIPEKFEKERQIGFIAQEVEEILPELVEEHNNGGEKYKSVAYANMTPVLVEAVKEQQKQIELLKQKLEKVQNEKVALEAKVDFIYQNFKKELKQTSETEIANNETTITDNTKK